MEFARQGAICQYDTCRQRDYLPFDCDRCQKRHCLSHRTREQHECPSLALDEAASRVRPPPLVLSAKFKCSRRGCRTRELQPIACRNCAHNFCIAHRFPTQHACEAFHHGVGKNTILAAGILPARPLDADKSSVASTQPITGLAERSTGATHALPSLPAAVVVAAADPIPVALASPSAILVNSNSMGQSCAAEMAAAASSSGTQAAQLAKAQSSGSISSESVAPAAATAAAANSKRHHNTNVAHLSKLLKQHS